LIYRAASHAAVGQLDEARNAAAELQKWNPGTTLAGLGDVLPFQAEADWGRMLGDLRKAGVPGK
jgi:hypothetical protein